jgi:hypothetical protein
MPSGQTKARGQRLSDGEIPDRPIRGAGIRIEYKDSAPAAVYPVEHSMVLHVEQRRVDEGKRRRLSLVEWWGHDSPPSHASRHVADLFARDSDVLDFAIQAMREKIARDRVRSRVDISRPVSFEISATDVVAEGYCTTLVLNCREMDGDGRFELRIPLESDDFAAQQRGQRELWQLCSVLGLREVDDADLLVGRSAVVIETDDGNLVFAPVRFRQAAA